MNNYRVKVLTNQTREDEVRRLLPHRDWAESLIKTVSLELESFDPPPSCVLLELRLPKPGGGGMVRFLGEGTDIGTLSRKRISTRSVLIAFVKDESLLKEEIDLETALKAPQANTLLPAGA